MILIDSYIKYILNIYNNFIKIKILFETYFCIFLIIYKVWLYFLFLPFHSQIFENNKNIFTLKINWK